MKWKRMAFTIVLNIFLMLMMSIALEYSDLTERFVSIEDTIQEALDMAISESVHSEEFFSANYQSKLMSYAGIGDTNNDVTAEASTLIWLQGARSFAQVNTYQFAKWYQTNRRLPSSMGDVSAITSIGMSHRYGLSGYIFEWLYGGAGSEYNSPGLAYANRNSARQAEYTGESTNRGATNADFQQYYNQVGRMQLTAGYLKESLAGTSSYRLALQTYPVLANMGLSWMDALNSASSPTTADNLCSSLHIGKSRYGANDTYYFLTPSSLGVTYVPVEVLKPVFVANLDTIVRLNRLGASSKNESSVNAKDTLEAASYCVETSVYDFNDYTDMYESGSNIGYVDGFNHAFHIPSDFDQTIVTDGLVEFDLSTIQVKVDYFYHDFSDGSSDSALLISKLNGTLSDGASSESSLRAATLQAFLNQDTSQYVSPFLASSYSSEYDSIDGVRIVARVTAKVKVHVPYQSSILQWACYMFTGTKHFDIKRFDPATQSAFQTVSDSDGLWYQYTTYFCTSRS